MNIYEDISYLKGVGPKMQKLLNSLGIINIIDLILYFPRDYEKYYINGDGEKTISGSKIIISGIVIRIDRDLRTKKGKVISTVVLKNNKGEIFKCKWFNQPYMKDKFIIDIPYTLSGKAQEFNGEKIIVNPSIIKDFKPINDLNSEKDTKLSPKYGLKSGITNNFLVKVISEILAKVDIAENLPEDLLKKYKLCNLNFAMHNIHNPKSLEALTMAQRRLKFQELFTYSLKILLLKEYVNNTKKGIAFKMSPDLKLLKESLPFALTNAQNRVIREILLDQKSVKQMNRLVQGDVGSGKTIVAIISIFNTIKNGYQAAFMAPTEILAVQHYVELNKILGKFNINISLLNGSVPKKQKDLIKEDIKSGNIQIVVGTHALLEESVEFNNLGLVVTDEQHRFGVMQRSKLFNKGKNIDILVMTATPIPRTISLFLYGDLDISIIDELPPGRQKIESSYLSESRRSKAYNFALEEIKNGRQVYVVCPLVEETENAELSSVEKLYNLLTNNYFKCIEIKMLHGKMSAADKNQIMDSFKKGETKVLVSTTVIEVGINVPNATIMIIENAERFGLAQLHQLRGRVGRGEYKSYCILIANIKNETIKKRLDIIQNNTDGFKIAEEDLKIRGGGELFGFKQHGDTGLILADLINDFNMLKVANSEARNLLKSPEAKDIKVKEDIIKAMDNTSRFICFN
ncbi:ATP-dependent DNA helicase RecG [Candidatus Clostridium radicumherbarum]|uniref:ATP-dependent DNA helicase RecG n=1 Tax=Candidatus Clostridium radicumherbarum TaxID=3381662 RepID=A0ABW8TRV1_9CLOT